MAKDKISEEIQLVTLDTIERKIFIAHGHKVLLDSDLALLYGVTTFNLNKAVKRNIGRFPEDFMFQLTAEEWDSLTFQNGISKSGRGGRRTAPYVFTEQGVAMLSSVLNSERAISVNIAIMRAFVNMRKILVTNEDVSRKLTEVEDKLGEHDENFKKVFTAIRLLMNPPQDSPRQIGYIQNSGQNFKQNSQDKKV